MTKEEALTLLERLRSRFLKEGFLDRNAINKAKEAITANQKYFSPDEIETVIVSLVKLGEWEFAEVFVRAFDDVDEKSCSLASLGIELAEIGLLEEATRIAESIPATEHFIDALLCKLDVLETLSEKHAENRDLEKAANVLTTVETLIARLGDHARQARRWAIIGEMWWTILGNKIRAVEAWQQAVEQVNIPFTGQKNNFDDRYQAWESVGAISIPIAKLGGLNLAKDILNSIVDEKTRNDAIRYASDNCDQKS